MKINSTYGLKSDYSLRAEEFLYIPLTWRLGVSKIELLKIRIATWKPKTDRSSQAIFYYDVTNKQKAYEILEKYKDFDFKEIENIFEEMFCNDTFNKNISFNTGQTREWLSTVFIPKIKQQFNILI